MTPLALGAEESWKAVMEGKCGIGPITKYDTSEQKVKLAAEVKGYDSKSALGREGKRMSLFVQYALLSSREAMAMSGLRPTEEEKGRCGVIISSGIGGLQVIEDEDKRGMERGFDKVSPHFIPSSISNMAAGQVAIDTGFRGMCSCPVTACAGGTYAVGDAFRYIRDGYADVMIAGGTEACITPLGVGGFTIMAALTQSTDPSRASIPFDKERSGFVMGEGAGILVLEELEHARKRNAGIIAEVVGYGVSCDAYHITAPSPDGRGGAKAMENAIADAGITSGDIDYINAHGTSTPLNDSGECKAVKSVFGEKAGSVAISSTKSMTGHLLGAAGAVEAIFTALSLRDGFIPATINYRVPDEDCDLDVVPNVGRRKPIRYALSNSLGFGGHNGALVFKKWEE